MITKIKEILVQLNLADFLEAVKKIVTYADADRLLLQLEQGFEGGQKPYDEVFRRFAENVSIICFPFNDPVKVRAVIQSLTKLQKLEHQKSIGSKVVVSQVVKDLLLKYPTYAITGFSGGFFDLLTDDDKFYFLNKMATENI